MKTTQAMSFKLALLNLHTLLCALILVLIVLIVKAFIRYVRVRLFGYLGHKMWLVTGGAYMFHIRKGSIIYGLTHSVIIYSNNDIQPSTVISG